MRKEHQIGYSVEKMQRIKIFRRRDRKVNKKATMSILKDKYFVEFVEHSGQVLAVGKVLELERYDQAVVERFAANGNFEKGVLTLHDLTSYDADEIYFFNTTEEVLSLLRKLGAVKENNENKKKFLLSDYLATPAIEA